MRAYPKGVRVSSSNLDPAPLWRSGVQMVALNWQYMNASMMLNHGMFADTGGWVLKPASHRPVQPHSSSTPSQPTPTPTLSSTISPAAAVAAPTPRGSLSLSLELFVAQTLTPPGSSSSEKLRASVRAELHVDQPRPRQSGVNLDALLAKGGEYKVSSHTVVGDGDVGVDFRRQVLEFRDVRDVTEELSFLRYV